MKRLRDCFNLYWENWRILWICLIAAAIYWKVSPSLPGMYQEFIAFLQRPAGDNKQNWTYFFPSAATLLGGSVLLLTSIYNYRQKNIQFDRDALEKQFKDVQDRFASADDKTRANAALQLAEMATIRYPGRGRAYTAKNNPFFARAASQFAIAINMEKDSGVRAAIMEALRIMTTFATDKPGEEHLHFLIRVLADANRTAYRNFLKALATYWVAQPQAYIEKTWEQLAVAASFCEDKELNQSVLEAQTHTTPFLNDCHILKELRRTTTDAAERKKSDATLLTDLQESADRLKQTREVLAHCLRVVDKIERIEFLGTFLAGSDLREAQLQGANLHGAQLQGADLHGAQLQGAYLREAQLQGANLWEAQLQGADLYGAQLQGARLYKAQLQGANLREALLQGADLNETQLKDAKVSFSTLDKAINVDGSWREANFTDWREVDTGLYARMEAKFGKKEKEKKTENTETVQAVVSTTEPIIATAPPIEDNVVIIGQNTQNDA